MRIYMKIYKIRNKKNKKFFKGRHQLTGKWVETGGRIYTRINFAKSSAKSLRLPLDEIESVEYTVNDEA